LQTLCFAPTLTDDGLYSFVTAGKNFETQARGPEFWTLDPYQVSFLGAAKSSLGDAKSSLGDAKSSR
jgi:hypothetical protein